MLIEEVDDHLYRLEVSLPEGGPMATNCYVVKGRERHLIIDPGHEHEACKAEMLEALHKLDIDPEQTDYFITHGHGDHCGLVRKMIREKAVVYASQTEASAMLGLRKIPVRIEYAHFLQVSGFPEKDPEKVMPPHLKKEASREPVPFRLVQDGETIYAGDYQWMCMQTPGHSAGHICLYEPNRRLFISGDHLFRSIGPSVQYRYQNESPLDAYLASLDRIEKLDVDRVLPGHRETFGHFRDRIDEVRQLIRRRCETALSILEEGGQNVYQIASRLNWNAGGKGWPSLSLFDQCLATGKTAAYLAHLEKSGKLHKELRDGEWIYALAV